MFNTLKQNSLFYIFDKNINPNIKIGKVKNISTNPQNYGLANQEIDITIDVNGDTYEFKKIPANLSIVSPSKGIIISDNVEDMTKEVEVTINNSQQIIDSIDYHKSILDAKDNLLSVLNPRFAREKEQESKLIALENKVDNILNMLSNAIQKKGEE